MRLAELATDLGCEVRGDGGGEIVGIAPIESAGPGELTFVANPRYARHVRTTRASAVILPLDAPEAPIASLRTADPYLAFAKAVDRFYQPLARERGVHETAIVAASATIGPRVSIGAYAVIGEGVRIGADAYIAPHVVVYPEVSIGDRFVAHAHVTIRERVRIGDDVVLQNGAVIGSDGFGYVTTPEGGIRKISQAGEVVLEDEVEIGANTTIDRATVGATFVRHSAKLDNLVMVGHGCDVGELTMLAAQVGLSGSTHIGRWVRIGGQAGLAGHLTIGDRVQIAAQSGVPNSLSDGAVVGGYPAMDGPLWRRVSAAVIRLPGLLRRVRRMEKQLASLMPRDSA